MVGNIMASIRLLSAVHFSGKGRFRCALPPILLAIGLFLSACGGGSNSPPPVQNGPTVQPVVTTGDRSMLLQPQPATRFTSGGSATQFNITVDDSVAYQQMDGFGASLTDSSAWLIWNKLDPSQQADLAQKLFSPSAGIGISFLRQPMGASDFSASGNYSYDDVPVGQTDPNLLNFSIAHDTAYIIPLLKQGLAANPAIKVVALPWSPPAWMKTTGTMNGGDMITTYFPSLAQYFVNYIQAYQQQGIPIYAVSVQNEPLYSTPNYPTEYLSASDESDFLANHLGPALTGAGLSNVKIFGYEHNWDNPGYAESVLATSAASYVAGTSFHCYAGDVSAQSDVKTAYPNKDIWFTECTGTVGSNFAGDLVWNSEHLLIGATRNWARSILLWNLALDQNSGPTNGGCPFCRGVVTIDDSTSPSTITNNVEYYVLGHLGKFVLPGAHRIASNTFGVGSIEDVAFRNPDGSIALFVLNSGGGSTQFTVSWKGQTFNYTLTGGAVATFTWK
jgi:glucosylceramidase